MKDQICTRCVMDTSDPDITFDENGVCNHCTEYLAKIKRMPADRRLELNNIFREIKFAGRGNKFDCIIMLSGGADSSLVALMAWRWGLRAVMVNIYDGWGIPETHDNVMKLAKKTGYLTVFHKLVPEEINDLYLSYLKAGVIDIETPIDHVIPAVAFEMAKKYKVNYILTGQNSQTEGIMAKAWGFNKMELKNLKDIHKKFGTVKLEKYPMISPWKVYWYRLLGTYNFVKPLEYVKYNRVMAIAELIKEVDWIPYPKNSESLFTRFDKRCILPMKFGVDKRRGNFSSMIMSGQLTRKRALEELEEGFEYDPPEMWIKDMDFFCEKLGITKDWFMDYIFKKPVPHTNYAYHKWLYKLLDVMRWIKYDLHNYVTFRRWIT